MIVEIIAVGTEILIGQISNTNSEKIARHLAAAGHDAHFQTVVGDNLARIDSALRLGLARADVLILTGGLGPTQDDLTREAICAVTGRSMTRDPGHAEWIEERARSQGRTLRSGALRMADLPDGAEALANSTGVALGVALEHEGKMVFALPGVPGEMEAMLVDQVIPRLAARSGAQEVIHSRVLRTWGRGESDVAETLADLYESANPSIAFLIHDTEVSVRISAKANTIEEAMALIGPIESEVRSRLGESVFGADGVTVEQVVLDLLGARTWTLATVEAVTMGQVGAALAPSLGALFAGTIVPGPETVSPPPSDVLLVVARLDDGPGDDPGSAVKVTVSTPEDTTSQVLHLWGDPGMRRAQATMAALHQLRLTLESA